MWSIVILLALYSVPGSIELDLDVTVSPAFTSKSECQAKADSLNSRLSPYQIALCMPIRTEPKT